MSYGVIIEGGDGLALHWAMTPEAAAQWAREHIAATPDLSGRRFTVVQVLWSIDE